MCIKLIVPALAVLVGTGCLSAHPEDRPTYAVEIEIEGNGRVLSDTLPACEDHCVYEIEHGMQLRLSPEPGEASEFIKWGGACASATTVCSPVVNEPTRITVRFAGPGDVEWILPVGGWPAVQRVGSETHVLWLDAPEQDYYLFNQGVYTPLYLIRWNADTRTEISRTLLATPADDGAISVYSVLAPDGAYYAFYNIRGAADLGDGVLTSEAESPVLVRYDPDGSVAFKFPFATATSQPRLAADNAGVYILVEGQFSFGSGYSRLTSLRISGDGQLEWFNEHGSNSPLDQGLGEVWADDSGAWIYLPGYCCQITIDGVDYPVSEGVFFRVDSSGTASLVSKPGYGVLAGSALDYYISSESGISRISPNENIHWTTPIGPVIASGSSGDLYGDTLVTAQWGCIPSTSCLYDSHFQTKLLVFAHDDGEILYSRYYEHAGELGHALPYDTWLTADGDVLVSGVRYAGQDPEPYSIDGVPSDEPIQRVWIARFHQPIQYE